MMWDMVGDRWAQGLKSSFLSFCPSGSTSDTVTSIFTSVFVFIYLFMLCCGRVIYSWSTFCWVGDESGNVISAILCRTEKRSSASEVCKIVCGSSDGLSHSILLCAACHLRGALCSWLSLCLTSL